MSFKVDTDKVNSSSVESEFFDPELEELYSQIKTINDLSGATFQNQATLTETIAHSFATFINMISNCLTLSVPGEGPTVLGQALSVAETAQSMARDFFLQLAAAGIGHNGEQPVQSSVRSPGRQLSNAIVISICGTLQNFFRRNFPEKNFNFIDSFIHTSQDTLNLEGFLDGFPKILESKPLYAPINLGNDLTREKSHIMIVYIREKNLFYYDPKGILSSNKQIGPDGDKKIFRTYLEALKDKYCLNGIHENEYLNQLDCHHCGAFICLYVYATSLIGLDPRELPKNIIYNSMIESLRVALAEEVVIYSSSKETSFEKRYPKTYSALLTSLSIPGTTTSQS